VIETAVPEPGGEPPVVEVIRVPPGTEDIGAPSFWGQSPARPMAATVGVFDVPAMRMPFAPVTAGETPTPPAAVEGPRAPSPFAGGTVAAPEVPALLPSGASELTMAQYTSLRVELHLLPERAASVLARYGIRPEAKEALFAHWRARFEVDPPLRMWFARDYARYLAWVRENPAALEGIR